MKSAPPVYMSVSFILPLEVKSLPLVVIEFCQPIQVQSHLEMPGILVQLGRIQCT